MDGSRSLGGATPRRFEPKISSFIVATTASRDTDVQKAEREITEKRLEHGGFPVSVAAWEDILLELAAHPDLAAKYFPSFRLERDDSETAVRADYLRASYRLNNNPRIADVYFGFRVSAPI